MKLTKAERLLISQIVNIQIDKATLKQHILLEGIFKASRPDEISIKAPIEFVDDEGRKIFIQYDGKNISEIEDESHKMVITEAIQKARVEELELWSNKDEGEDVELNGEQLRLLKAFFDKDNRTFPRENHAAILSLHEKLTDDSKSENN